MQATHGERGGWGIFGLTGSVGEALAEALGPGDEVAWALSRRPPAAPAQWRWIAGALPAAPVLPPVRALASLGPLDAFTEWFEASGHAPERVVALGSTSLSGKRDSPDPAERALAARLGDCERRLEAACRARGSALLVLRPTLIWGRGRDRNLSRWVALGRRLRWLPFPADGRGLRQPIHADEVAAAVLAALRRPTPLAGGFDLPGAETLPYDRMVARCLAAAAPGARLLKVPGPLFRAALRLAGGRGPGRGVVARLGRDLAFDGEPVRAALALSARPFRPAAADFPGPGPAAPAP